MSEFIAEMERLFGKHFSTPDSYTLTSKQLVSEPRLYATFGNLWRHSREATGKLPGRYFIIGGHAKDGTLVYSDVMYIDARSASYHEHSTMHVLEAEHVQNMHNTVIERARKYGGLTLHQVKLPPVVEAADVHQLQLSGKG
jgi:hypothetical protein